MKLVINGEEKKLDVKNLKDVVKNYRLEKNLIVIEIDGEIIDRERWQETEMKDGMNIELVHFVGGG